MPDLTADATPTSQSIAEISPHLQRTRLILVLATAVAFIQVNFLNLDETRSYQSFLNILLGLSLVYHFIHTQIIFKYLNSVFSFLLSLLIYNTLLTLLTIYSDGLLVYLILIYFIGYLVVLTPMEIIALTLIQIFYFNLINFFNLVAGLALIDLIRINSIFIFLGVSAANLVSEVKDKNSRVTELKELNQLKNTFIAIISHNLRTPITAVSGYLNLINKALPASNQQTKKDIKNALYNVDNLSGLVDDIIELTKIESGQAIFDLEKVDMVRLTKKMLEVHFEKLSELKGLKLNFDASDTKIQEAYVDEKRTSIAISNVIDNAIKFTEHGEVSIKLNQEGNFLVISVKDTGPGITDENMLRVFQHYDNFGEFFNTESSGLGLGLYTTKLIIESQHGLVNIDTIPGQGTLFTIKLPCS